MKVKEHQRRITELTLEMDDNDLFELRMILEISLEMNKTKHRFSEDQKKRLEQLLRELPQM